MPTDSTEATDLPVVRAVRQVLAAGGPPEQLGWAVLEAIGDSLGWLVGSVWLRDATGRRLRPVATWRARVHAGRAFEQMSQGLTFERGEGLPGRVWEVNELRCYPDIFIVSNFPRLEPARAEQLRGALAFPLRANGEAIGAVEFFTSQLHPQILALADAFLQIGEVVGRRLSSVVGTVTH